MQEKNKRKNIRMPFYDYSSPGLYFITICTADKKTLFSNIVGAYHDAPVQTELTEYGKIVEEIILFLPTRFKVSIENYVIMPDHIHLLLEINDYDRAIRESPLQSRSILSSCIGFLKADATKKIRKINPDIKVWQRSYMEHLIRNQKDYEKHYLYIEDNPVSWILGRHTV